VVVSMKTPEQPLTATPLSLKYTLPPLGTGVTVAV